MIAFVVIVFCGLSIYGLYVLLNNIARYDQVEIYPNMSAYLRAPTYYEMDTDTILTSLNRRQTDVFTLITSTPEAEVYTVPVLEKPIGWHQSDYMKVANALFEFQWHEPLDGWKLYLMSFETRCSDNISGFDGGTFYYFITIVGEHGGKDNIGRQMLIMPQYGQVIVGGNSNYPYKRPGWKSIDLNKVVVTADDTLKIAEKNGGREARLSVQNKCYIQSTLSEDFLWQVLIFKDSEGIAFEIHIDPYTGQVKK